MKQIRCIVSKTIQFTLCLCFSFTMFHCDIIIDLETINPNIYIDTKSNVNNGDSITIDSVYISWFCEEENEQYSEFRYKLNHGEYSDWGNQLNSFSARLDDNKYIFIVQARFSNLNTQSSKAIQFVVNALHSPAVYAYPRQQTFSSDTAEVIIKTKDIPPSYGMEITFSSDSSMIGNQIYGSNDPNVQFSFENKKAFLMVLPGGKPFKGNCDLMRISISGIVKDSSKFDIETCTIWDSTTTNIDLAMIRGSFLIKENKVNKVISNH